MLRCGYCRPKRRSSVMDGVEMGLTVEEKRVVFLLPTTYCAAWPNYYPPSFGVCLDSIRSCVPRHPFLTFLS